MRILYLSPWFPYPLDTGFRTRVHYLLRALAGRHRVTLLTLDPQGWAPAHVEPVAQICEHIAIVPRDPFRRGRWRTATRFFGMKPVMADPFPEMLEQVRQLHAQQPFDLVISASVVMAAYALFLPGVPRVLEEHNSHTRWMYERYKAQTSALEQLRCWVSWRKSARFEAHLFPRFDLVSMVSEQDAAYTRSLLPTGKPPVAVFPNAVNCDQLHLDLAEPQPNTLVFSGALTYHANYEAMRFFLSQVYPLIQTSRPDVKLRITGAADGVDMQSLHLDESVTLTGFVEDVRQEIAGAWISVVPIRSGGGTRLKILEAMALGTPVVSTPKGAEGINAHDCEHLLLADDPAAFACCTVELLDNPDLRRRLASNARRLVETHYDWNIIGARFVDLIEAVVRERKKNSA